MPKSSFLEISKGLNNLNKYNVNICSLVVDGSRPQLNAINQIILNSNDKKIRSLLIIPCLCHKVHNSLTSAVRKNNELSAIIHQVHNISKILFSLYQISDSHDPSNDKLFCL